MRACPLCSYNHRELLYTTPVGQTIHCCQDCGFVFSDDTPEVNYAVNSTYSCAETYPPKTSHYQQIVENCIDAGISRKSEILDVGCALGNQIQKFMDYGFSSVHGLSVSPQEILSCAKRGFVSFPASVLHEPRQQYDLVVLSHVLEHIPEPIPFLRALRRWVKPTGLLYVEVPDAIYYAECFASVCQGFNNEHINHFDGLHLGEALIRSGFDITGTGAFTANDGHPYPCVWRIASPRVLANYSREFIQDYIKVLNMQMEKIKEHIAEQLGDDFTGPLAIWGAGQTAHLLLDSPILNRCFVEAATDTNPAYWGQRIHQCMVVAPHLFKPRASVPLLVCSQLSQKVIVETIKEMGLPNRLIIPR